MLHDPAPSMHNSEWGLARYLQQARRFSLLSSQEAIPETQIKKPTLRSY
jgi:hypothetical protein